MITVSAPGKIHLLGEHAVVYAKPALLAAIDKRLYVRIKNLEFRIKNNKEEIVINTREKKDLVWETIKIFQKSFSIKKLPPFEITITSQIPTGCGLGSSAALSSALIGALMKFVKNIWNPNKINELAYKVEKIAHGNSSGADNTTVVFGGLVWYRREFEFLKSIWSLPVSLYKIPKFAIINSGCPQESTREMVFGVSKLYTDNKKTMEEIFSDQELQTRKLLLALKTDSKAQLIDAIRKGEGNLEKIGVVGKFAQKIIREVESIGGAAKICGAGGRKKGSGILLAFHPDLSKVNKIAKKFNTKIQSLVLGGEGIRVEQQS